jgi:hypothetical protein
MPSTLANSKREKFQFTLNQDRSRSAAWRTFFERDSQASQRSPQRGQTHRHAEQCAQLAERRIGVLLHDPLQLLEMFGQSRLRPGAATPGSDLPRFTPPSQ